MFSILLNEISEYKMSVLSQFEVVVLSLVMVIVKDHEGSNGLGNQSYFGHFVIVVSVFVNFSLSGVILKSIFDLLVILSSPVDLLSSLDDFGLEHVSTERHFFDPWGFELIGSLIAGVAISTDPQLISKFLNIDLDVGRCSIIKPICIILQSHQNHPFSQWEQSKPTK